MPRLGITNSKCEIRPSIVVQTLPGGGRMERRSGPTLTGPGGDVFHGLMEDFEALLHLGHADLVPRQAVAFPGTADLEVEIGIGQVRLVAAEVADHAARPGDRARCNFD